MLDAVAEAFDNADDAGASKITLILASDSVSFVDNGKGLKDLDDLFGLGYSKSKAEKEAIGQYGKGVKDTQLHFGTLVEVHSVHRGRYYRHKIDWDKVRTGGPFNWPFRFDGASKPASAAPAEIRKGGTIIKISRLVTNRPRANLDVLAKKLSHRYLLGLRKGTTITVIDQRGSVPKEYVLSAELATRSINPGEIVAGEAAGQKFNVMFTTLKQDHDAALPGVHFGFGSRFVMRVQRLGEQGLPPNLYAEVRLSSDWKECLSPNKTSIIAYEAELHEAVLAILQGLISKLEKQAEQVQIEHVNLALAKDFANVLVFAPQKTGVKKKSKKTAVVTGRREGPGPVNPNPSKKAALPEDGGEHGSELRKKRPNGIAFQRNDTLSMHVASEHELKNSMLMIHLNGNIPAIAVGYQPPYKPIALWPVIAREFAKFTLANSAEIDRLIPGFIDALNADGWEVSADLPNELADKVFTFIMRQIPLNKAERAKISKLKLVDAETETS